MGRQQRADVGEAWGDDEEGAWGTVSVVVCDLQRVGVWAVRGRLVMGWGQAESCDGGTAVDIADDVAQVTNYTATVSAACSTLVKTTGTR